MAPTSGKNNHSASRTFVGIGIAGEPPALVVQFRVGNSKQTYYMTMQELCDWIEHQMASGIYHDVRALMAVDRQALQSLIEAQRKVLMGRKTLDDYPAIAEQSTSFANYVLTTYVRPMTTSDS